MHLSVEQREENQNIEITEHGLTIQQDVWLDWKKKKPGKRKLCLFPMKLPWRKWLYKELKILRLFVLLFIYLSQFLLLIIDSFLEMLLFISLRNTAEPGGCAQKLCLCEPSASPYRSCFWPHWTFEVTELCKVLAKERPNEWATMKENEGWVKIHQDYLHRI